MFIRKLLRNEIQIKVIAVLEIVNVRLIRHDNVKNSVIIVIQHDNDVVMGKGDTCGNTTGIETSGVAVIPRGWNMFIQEPHKILPKIKKSDARISKFFFSNIFIRLHGDNTSQ